MVGSMGGGMGMGTMGNNAEQFVWPHLGQGSGGRGGGWALQWRAARAAVLDSWAQAGGAGGRQRQRQ
jgi:hypothetical protein